MLYSTMRNEHAETGDLVVVEGKSIVSRLIRAITGQTFSHVGVIAFIDEAKTCLMVTEMREFRGYGIDRASRWFENQISAGSKVYFVKKPQSVTDIDAVYKYAFTNRELKYDYKGLFLIWLSALKKKGLRGAIDGRKAEVCSTFSSSAWVKGGWDKPDKDLTPGDFLEFGDWISVVTPDPIIDPELDDEIVEKIKKDPEYNEQGEVAVLDTESDNTV